MLRSFRIFSCFFTYSPSYAVDSEIEIPIIEVSLHTGQHYDYEMSQLFFDELSLKALDYHFGVGSGNHGYQTGEMLKKIEEVLFKEKPHLVIVYGDTNSTPTGTLTAAELYIHMANVVINIGEVLYESVLLYSELAKGLSNILQRLELESKGYSLAAVHRAENTDEAERLRNNLKALQRIAQEGLPAIFPVHPRTLKASQSLSLDLSSTGLKMIEPGSFLNILVIEKNARAILTDFGGVRNKAFFCRVPCVTLREETEGVP